MPDFDARGNTPRTARSGGNGGFASRGNVGSSSSGGSDVVAPSVSVVSPAEGSDIEADTPLVVDVTDAVDLASTPLYATFPGAPSSEMVYQGAVSVGGTPTNAGFLRPYATNSTAVDVSGGLRLSIRRDGGWPGAVSLTFLPVDSGGNAS